MHLMLSSEVGLEVVNRVRNIRREQAQLVTTSEWSSSETRTMRRVVTANMAMSGFRANPQQGPLTRVLRIYGYLRKMNQGCIRVDTCRYDFRIPSLRNMIGNVVFTRIRRRTA
jgi:hypothetical protein